MWFHDHESWPKASSSIFTFIPCQREIALNGLSALSVRKLLNAVRFELPSTAKLTTDTYTSMKNVVWAHLVKTHDYDDEVEASPDAAKVAPESESDPLEKHLDGEEDGEDKVDNLQDEFQLLIVLEVDIFKAEGQTANIEYWDIAKANDRPGCKDEEEDGPLEEGVVDDVVDDGP